MTKSESGFDQTRQNRDFILEENGIIKISTGQLDGLFSAILFAKVQMWRDPLNRHKVERLVILWKGKSPVAEWMEWHTTVQEQDNLRSICDFIKWQRSHFRPSKRFVHGFAENITCFAVQLDDKLGCFIDGI